MICWVSGPYLFAAVALSSISVYEKGLSPAVAFTAIAVFQRLEIFLALVPVMITDISNAWISFDRIEVFLSSSEQVDYTIKSDIIEFQHASVAWPSAEKMSKQAQLHNIDLKFPKNGLSIITGPTGSGKSLLLSAIIGEADILSGTVKRPKSDANTTFSRYGTSQCWIIPQKIAFVAQTAWIENATIQDNILFGLPLAQDRYFQILNSCALSHDTEIMEDGDQTEVGARGISLSGGQRLRLSLARALYSQAEFLIVDDVFSAVDIHVAHHILENAMTGELVKGRTVVLVTHNVSLCWPKANFAVILNEGRVAYAGAPPDPMGDQQPHSLSEQKSLSDFTEQQASQRSDSNVSVAVKQMTSKTSSVANDSLPKQGPRKLIQEEGYKTGRTEFDVYRRYFKAASRWPWLYWIALLALVVG